MRFLTTLRPTTRLAPRVPIRPFHAARIMHQDQGKDSNGSFIDGLVDGEAKGRTGGGEALDASSKNAPPQPKVSNQSIPGNQTDELTEEQKKEVEEHNRDFDKKHDRGNVAPDDKVDKKFWGDGRHGEKDNKDTTPKEEK
ncbi:hypothetical protein FCIRC_10572 [Fusarium circinatum]|uniref:Uncharacterized protein n=1 Tax=Fusarium circinatum TaxID=48490 RepID=A0A8H5WPJ2_FUSCI|nr:hypothetical protein FCIRC_10572 [Fusarium circinatum]